VTTRGRDDGIEIWATALMAVWLAAVGVRFQRSRPVLLGGMFAGGALTMAAWAYGGVTFAELGMTPDMPWLWTLGAAVVWTGVMYAYSSVADRIASALVAKPPILGAFKPLQQSPAKLLAGIPIAWFLGGFLEELIFRGILLQTAEICASPWIGTSGAAIFGIVVAAMGAAVIHLYQGDRAALIIFQLSILFGVLFVITGNNLRVVVLCHGFYDTIAVIRFAMGKSKYSKVETSVSMTDNS